MCIVRERKKCQVIIGKPGRDGCFTPCPPQNLEHMGADAPDPHGGFAGRTIRVAVVDDQPIVVEGLLSVLNNMPGFLVVHSAYSGDAFMRGLPEQGAVDVAIVDLQMPGTDGFAVLQRLRDERSEIHAIAYSFNNDHAWVRRAINSGARAYVLKEALPKELEPTVRAMLQHGCHFSGLVRASLIGKRSQEKPTRIDWRTVPTREREFARKVLESGDPTYFRIAIEMGVSRSAVNGYYRWFHEHYKVQSRVELVRLLLNSPLEE